MTISPSYPDLLQNGNPADATEVMANFYQIQNDVNANAAANGANSDITSLTGLTTPLGVAYGGTGVTSYAALITAAGIAPLASPALTGVPTTPTAAPGTNTIQIASTAFVTGALGSYLTTAAAASTYAPLASPALTGVPTAPTAAPGTSTIQLATTAFVTTALGTLVFTKSFTSSQLTFTDGSVHTVTHGLGGVPKAVIAELVCTTADLDYSVGDHVFLASWIFPSSQNYGSTVSYNATTISVTIGSSGYYISYKSGANKSLITDTSWRILIKAYA